MRKTHSTHNPTIQAIQTRWNGYRFRSRTEARWAVLLTNLGIKYEYEHEGFVLPSGDCYLPDFYLPDHGAVIEIKPKTASESDIAKPKEFAWSQTELRVYLGIGVPEKNELIYLGGRGDEGPSGYAYFAECPLCKTITIGRYAEPVAWVGCVCLAKDISDVIGEIPLWARELIGDAVIEEKLLDRIERPNVTPRIFAALAAARAARFEFGDSPEVP